MNRMAEEENDKSGAQAWIAAWVASTFFQAMLWSFHHGLYLFARPPWIVKAGNG